MKKPALERDREAAAARRCAARAARQAQGVFRRARQGRAPRPTFARDELRAGNRIEGPALIEEHASTTVVLPGRQASVDQFGNLVIEVGKRTRWSQLQRGRPVAGVATRAARDQHAAPTPVLTEIVRNGVLAVTEEMKTNLTRTAYNMIIYEALDFTVGLYTAEGETISIGLGLPMFIRGMAETVKAKLAHFGRDGIDPATSW